MPKRDTSPEQSEYMDDMAIWMIVSAVSSTEMPSLSASSPIARREASTSTLTAL
ncbi:hypothetical protein D3C87_2181430 [compost metagenome]